MVLVLALVPIALVGALALSSRGLGGSLSNGWKNLTDPHATATISNAPDRLTAVGSVRARYWNEALKIAKAHKALGVGAGGYATVRPRFRADTLDVRHAHGYIVQTVADLGLVGMAVSLALLAAWLAAASRTVGLWGAAPARAVDARAGGDGHAPGHLRGLRRALLHRLDLVRSRQRRPRAAVRGVAGRPGPTEEPIARRSPPRLAVREPWRIGLAVAAVAVAVVAAWASWQPQHAVAEGSDALGTAEAGNFAQARRQIAHAERTNPLSVDLLFQQAAIEGADGNTAGARSALQEAVHKQPANPATWLALAEFELGQGRKPQALSAVGSALYLDPRSQEAITIYLQASGRQ